MMHCCTGSCNVQVGIVTVEVRKSRWQWWHRNCGSLSAYPWAFPAL